MLGVLGADSHTAWEEAENTDINDDQHGYLWHPAPGGQDQFTAGVGMKLDMPEALAKAGPSGEQTPRSMFEISAHVPSAPQTPLQPGKHNQKQLIPSSIGHVSLRSMLHRGHVIGRDGTHERDCMHIACLLPFFAYYHHIFTSGEACMSPCAWPSPQPLYKY